MNSTNRGLNRALILIAGLILLIVGAAAIVVGAVPQFASAWKTEAPLALDTITGWLKATPLGSTGHSWLWIAAAAVALVVILVLLIIMLTQGGGRTRALLRDEKTENGRTYADSSVAEQLLQHSLNERPELVSSHVSTYDVKGTSVLKVSVLCRRGVSPREASQLVEDLLLSLDELLGHAVPALIQVSGGFRVRSAGSTRLA